ncbi:glycosyltransferase family 2 protein [Acidipila rosea]|uniref:Cellulose synthase/poly-beta-1,6-N-acetylglucosamine synthase-like glycosyltransferase n=1 Tax=Acidipila rosea TaxID=768535 RepID=A0A4R1LB01_9BACT|nr:glycosyltransferase family 2 protein [Acidipila rosea]TCK73649.1 cellulose synthase/poly-beta-1,6-N-acetylglucosamine synthase-like glycosyltransferase [Acidipila rosea]
MMLSLIVFCCAVLPAALFLWNLAIYRPPAALKRASRPGISLLIPARNEEQSIAAAVEHALASQDVELELIVLDDASTDRTAEIVREFSTRDGRVRFASAPRLPAGWNGKQHACHVLASLASHDLLCFLDADVRLAPQALTRMAGFLHASGSDLVSGFPREETGTFLERLLLPLIHFVLLGYLPLAAMRRSKSRGFAAGCGQFMMAKREAYFATGGHASIRSTMHDGLLLPRLFREHGFRTDLADLTDLAACRMYRDARQVWQGLAKNATEGMAAPARILPFSLLLFFGQVLPLALALALLLWSRPTLPGVRALVYGALVASYMPRLIAVVRYRQSFAGAILHPVGVSVLLILQWYALVRKLSGHTFTWKQRAYDAG